VLLATLTIMIIVALNTCFILSFFIDHNNDNGNTMCDYGTINNIILVFLFSRAINSIST